jgi:hypothetical protein
MYDSINYHSAGTISNGKKVKMVWDGCAVLWEEVSTYEPWLQALGSAISAIIHGRHWQASSAETMPLPLRGLGLGLRLRARLAPLPGSAEPWLQAFGHCHQCNNSGSTIWHA